MSLESYRAATFFKNTSLKQIKSSSHIVKLRYNLEITHFKFTLYIKNSRPIVKSKIIFKKTALAAALYNGGVYNLLNLKNFKIALSPLWKMAANQDDGQNKTRHRTLLKALAISGLYHDIRKRIVAFTIVFRVLYSSN